MGDSRRRGRDSDERAARELRRRARARTTCVDVLPIRARSPAMSSSASDRRGVAALVGAEHDRVSLEEDDDDDLSADSVAEAEDDDDDEADPDARAEEGEGEGEEEDEEGEGEGEEDEAGTFADPGADSEDANMAAEDDDDDPDPDAGAEEAMDGRDYHDEDVNGNYDELEAEPEGAPATLFRALNLDSFRSGDSH